MQAALLCFLVGGFVVAGANFQEIAASRGPGDFDKPFLVTGHTPVFLAVTIAGATGYQLYLQFRGGFAVHQQAPSGCFTSIEVIGVGQHFQLQPLAGGLKGGLVRGPQGDKGLQTVVDFHQLHIAGVLGQFGQHLVDVVATAPLALAVHFIHQEVTGLGHGDAIAAFLLQFYVEYGAGVHLGHMVHRSRLAIWTGDFHAVYRVGALKTKNLVGDAGIHGDPLGLGYRGVAGEQPQFVGLRGHGCG